MKEISVVIEKSLDCLSFESDLTMTVVKIFIQTPAKAQV